MKIGIDIDEVIVNFIEGFIGFYNGDFKTNLRYCDFNSYKFEDVLGKSEEEVKILIDEFYESDLFDNLKLIKDAQKSIYELSKKNDLVAVTSRPKRFKKKTDILFDKYFNGINLSVFYSDDFNSRHAVGKAKICQNMGVNFLIEDNFEYAVMCFEAGTGGLLLDKPWNQGSYKSIQRVEDWNEILERLNEY